MILKYLMRTTLQSMTLLSKWTISSVVTFIATVRTFFCLVLNWLIHFIMQTSCNWSSRVFTSHVGVRYEIWLGISRPIIFVSNGMKFNLICFSNRVYWINECRHLQMIRVTNDNNVTIEKSKSLEVATITPPII